MKFDFGDGGRRKRMPHGNKPEILNKSRSVAFAIVVGVVINSSF
jgi:hypothetical protein